MGTVLKFPGKNVAHAPVRVVPDASTCPVTAASADQTNDAILRRTLVMFEAQCAIAMVAKYGEPSDLEELRSYIGSCLTACKGE